MRLRFRTETLLALGCAASAGILAASAFMTLFHLTPPGGEALVAIESLDQAGWAYVVLAALALIALGFAIGTGSKPAAMVVAVAGGVALLIFLISDVPDANNIGTLEEGEFVDAKAEPQLGFWLTLIGSLLLTVGGGALATLTPEQLLSALGREQAAPARRRRRGATTRKRTTRASTRRRNTNSAGPTRSAESAEPAEEAFDWPSKQR